MIKKVLNLLFSILFRAMLCNSGAAYFDEGFQYKSFLSVDQVHLLEIGFVEKEYRYFLLSFLFDFVSVRSDFPESNMMFRLELEIHPFNELLPN